MTTVTVASGYRHILIPGQKTVFCGNGIKGWVIGARYAKVLSAHNPTEVCSDCMTMSL